MWYVPWEPANSFKSVQICLDEVFFLCWGDVSLGCWRSWLTILASVVGFFCCTNFLFWRLTAQFELHNAKFWHMMGVLGLLVPVCLLCTIMSVDGLQHIFLWESSLLLYPVFQTGVFWIHCKLSGMSWMTSVLLVNHQHWYVWGTAWQMHAVTWHYHLRQCWPCTWESKVCLVQSQLASGQLQRLWLLNLSKTSDNSIVLGSAIAPMFWQLVVPCEMVSAE